MKIINPMIPYLIVRGSNVWNWNPFLFDFARLCVPDKIESKSLHVDKSRSEVEQDTIKNVS